MMKKMAKNTLKIRAEPAAMLVNPNTAAANAIIKQIKVHDGITTPFPHDFPTSTFQMTLAVLDTRRKRPRDGRRVNCAPRLPLNAPASSIQSHPATP